MKIDTVYVRIIFFYGNYEVNDAKFAYIYISEMLIREIVSVTNNNMIWPLVNEYILLIGSMEPCAVIAGPLDRWCLFEQENFL
jgi:hypothetical protein